MDDHDVLAPTSCPLLGLVGDRWTRFELADRRNRCWAKAPAREVEVAFQTAICSGPDFCDCILYYQWDKGRPIAARGQTRRIGLGKNGFLPELVDGDTQNGVAGDPEPV
jgi:hypothetical protein